MYLQEVSASHALCKENEAFTAVHTRGKTLQVYRQYESKSRIASSIRKMGESMDGWDTYPFWRSIQTSLLKLKVEVGNRVKKHKQQHEVFTHGVHWEGRPILIHAYKFEPDPILKVELILPDVVVADCPPELPLHRIASAIRCHDYLVPKNVAVPQPPYERHETKFQTLIEYLRAAMPKETYASRLFAGDG